MVKKTENRNQIRMRLSGRIFIAPDIFYFLLKFFTFFIFLFLLKWVNGR